MRERKGDVLRRRMPVDRFDRAREPRVPEELEVIAVDERAFGRENHIALHLAVVRGVRIVLAVPPQEARREAHHRPHALALGVEPPLVRLAQNDAAKIQVVVGDEDTDGRRLRRGPQPVREAVQRVLVHHQPLRVGRLHLAQPQRRLASHLRPDDSNLRRRGAREPREHTLPQARVAHEGVEDDGERVPLGLVGVVHEALQRAVLWQVEQRRGARVDELRRRHVGRQVEVRQHGGALGERDPTLACVGEDVIVQRHCVVLLPVLYHCRTAALARRLRADVHTLLQMIR
mmetsp:Transcript_19917/g.61950  ORF Transcript_19917/g.61950 Transcript_19917/m.61950 type:complete len:288 (-) Transcript_19917:162-1025(-)